MQTNDGKEIGQERREKIREEGGKERRGTRMFFNIKK